ncbi:MAG: sugar phosphate isomerase/epimerase [Alphaproteobacteria bacterium]|nr:sugar phosphate isomerase/epimerase [Alphaproteobacteria bacterium]
MPKLGVITDGISRDFEHALKVMKEFDLEYAELQFLWDKEVGDLDDAQRARARALVRDYDVTVSCISRHVFGGVPMSTKPGDDLHNTHMDGLRRCIEMAHEFECGTVRIMSGKKEMILWGSHGAEDWNVAKGAWDSLLAIVEPALRLAETQNVQLVVETGNGNMINSAWTARKLIDDLGTDRLKVLWDPANACFCHETMWPDGYDALRGGYLGHVHIKDVQVDTPKATLEVRQMGQGQLADQFQPAADAMKADGYDGVISFESVYHPGDKNYEAGFRACIGTFKEIFG